MGPETYHLVADSVLEAQDHRNGDNHHSQTDSYPYGGYTNGRNADIMLAFLSENSSGDEKREIHLIFSSSRIGF